MLEPILVESAAIFPHRCTCGSSTAPLLDTHMELAGYGRLYVCQLCAKTWARVFGFADGKRLDELSEASASVGRMEREVASTLEQLGNATAEIAILERTVGERDARITELDEHVSQLETTIRESAEAARAHLALVGNE